MVFNIGKLLFIFIVTLYNNTHAYLDPNSGSGVIAFFVAIFAGICFYSKKIFYMIKNLLKKD